MLFVYYVGTSFSYSSFMKNVSLSVSILFLALSLSLVGCGAKTSTDIPAPPDTLPQEVTTPDDTAVTGEEDTSEATKTEENESTAAGEQTNLAPSDTPRWIAEGWLYLPYTPTALAQAAGDIVLFFYASWSPSAINTDKDITAKKEKLPDDLTILRVNFDDAEAMKQQYGITDPQTFVQVTNTGELIKKWRGANTLEDIIQQIQK